MSACISSHGEYDSHETDPDTFVCKWCHEFDETGALAEIARLRRAPVTGVEHAIEQAARALALTDDYDGCFERIDAWEAATDEQRHCGDVEEPMTSDEEDCEFWRRRARALAEAGLLAPAPLTEVRSRGTLNPRTGVLHFFSNDSAEYVKYHTGWLPVDRAEGDGSADQ